MAQLSIKNTLCCHLLIFDFRFIEPETFLPEQKSSQVDQKDKRKFDLEMDR